jgi:hypothetical protein
MLSIHCNFDGMSLPCRASILFYFLLSSSILCLQSQSPIHMYDDVNLPCNPLGLENKSGLVQGPGFPCTIRLINHCTGVVTQGGIR